MQNFKAPAYNILIRREAVAMKCKGVSESVSASILRE
jgi:hypothetical protein